MKKQKILTYGEPLDHIRSLMGWSSFRKKPEKENILLIDWNVDLPSFHTSSRFFWCILACISSNNRAKESVRMFFSLSSFWDTKIIFILWLKSQLLFIYFHRNEIEIWNGMEWIFFFSSMGIFIVSNRLVGKSWN